jgi:hypothetical protein
VRWHGEDRTSTPGGPAHAAAKIPFMKKAQIEEDIQVLRAVASDEAKLGFVRQGALNTIALLQQMLDAGQVR